MADWKASSTFLQSHGVDIVVASAAKEWPARENGDCFVISLLAVTGAAQCPNITGGSRDILQTKVTGSEARTPFVRCNEKTTDSASTPKITIAECERNCPFSARSEIISHSLITGSGYSHRQITRPVLRQISSKPTRMADFMHPKKKSPWFRARRVWFCTCFVAVIMSNYRAKLGRPRQVQFIQSHCFNPICLL